MRFFESTSFNLVRREEAKFACARAVRYSTEHTHKQELTYLFLYLGSERGFKDSEVWSSKISRLLCTCMFVCVCVRVFFDSKAFYSLKSPAYKRTDLAVRGL